MKTKRKTGPMPFKKADKRIPQIVMLSPKEQQAMARLRGEIPFSTWARGVLVAETKKGKGGA